MRQTVNGSGTVVAARDYYPYGELLRGYNNALANEKYKFNEKEQDIETGFFYYGARYSDPYLGIWLQVDPLWEKYYGWSPFNYTACNPLIYVDPSGMDYYTTTYTDYDGNVLDVKDDNKTDIYRQTKDGKGWEHMGNSVQVLSFVDQDIYNETGDIVPRGKIDYGSTTAGDKIKENLNRIDPSWSGFMHYAKNAGEGETYDIKKDGDWYSGSQIAPGLYGTMRDAGNILAGAAAAKCGIPYDDAMSLYGAYSAANNSKILGIIIFTINQFREGGMANYPSYGEMPVSHQNQSWGYKRYKNGGF